MEITRESLRQRYSDLTDAEVLRRARSGALTELAREVALAELAERGISLADVVDPLPPAPHATIEFAEDEFERNPYQAPRPAATAPLPGAVPLRRRIADLLWFAYIALYGLFTLAAAFSTPELDAPHALRELADPGLILPAAALVGLVAWRLRLALLSPLLWVGCFAVNLALVADQMKNYYEFAAADTTGYSELFLAWTLAGITVQAPMFWGLARYAFGSRAIWKRRAPQRVDSSPDSTA